MIEQQLQALSPLPLQIVWHTNRTTYLTIRKEKQRLLLRLHCLFREVEKPVLQAVLQMALKRDAAARALVRVAAHRYFSQNRIPPKPLNPIGKIYHLQTILNQIQQTYFPTEESPTIGWTPARIGRFRSITFGTYSRQGNQIRINSLLDHPEVPLYFVEFIVYHEMLHAVCPSQIHPSGRCRVHTKEFRHKERQFPHYQAAKEWGKKSLTFFKKNLISC